MGRRFEGTNIHKKEQKKGNRPSSNTHSSVKKKHTFCDSKSSCMQRIIILIPTSFCLIGCTFGQSSELKSLSNAEFAVKYFSVSPSVNWRRHISCLIRLCKPPFASIMLLIIQDVAEPQTMNFTKIDVFFIVFGKIQFFAALTIQKTAHPCGRAVLLLYNVV